MRSPRFDPRPQDISTAHAEENLRRLTMISRSTDTCPDLACERQRSEHLSHLQDAWLLKVKGLSRRSRCFVLGRGRATGCGREPLLVLALGVPVAGWRRLVAWSLDSGIQPARQPDRRVLHSGAKPSLCRAGPARRTSSGSRQALLGTSAPGACY